MITDVRLARVYLSIATRPPAWSHRSLVERYGPVEAAQRVADTHEQPCDWETVAARCLDLARRRRARFVAPEDGEWPGALRNRGAGASPVGLWVRGTAPLDELLRSAVVIAGARGATPYGLRVAAQIADALALTGWTVTNTGAYGIDGAALRAALSAGGRTAAVTAGGPARPGPLGHTALFGRIAETGVLVGETLQRSGDFDVSAARLLPQLAAAVVVVEPAARGMSGIIARNASAAGRPVFAVPGPVFSPEFDYAHTLIKDGDAELVTGSVDVLASLPERRVRR